MSTLKQKLIGGRHTIGVGEQASARVRYASPDSTPRSPAPESPTIEQLSAADLFLGNPPTGYRLPFGDSTLRASFGRIKRKKRSKSSLESAYTTMTDYVEAGWSEASLVPPSRVPKSTRRAFATILFLAVLYAITTVSLRAAESWTTFETVYFLVRLLW